MEDVQLSSEQEAMKIRLQEFEEHKKKLVEQELASLSTVHRTHFIDQCEFLKEEVQTEPAPEDQTIRDAKENEEFVFRTNITYLEKTLEFSLKTLFKEAENKMNNLRINWNRTIIENSEEKNQELIEQGYNKHIEIFGAHCELIASQATYLLRQAKGEYDNREGTNGTANVLINFQYIAVVPMEEIVQILHLIEESITKLIDLLQDQNGNGKEDEANRIQLLIRKWFNRDMEIQEKQFDLLNALKGHPADPALRNGMQSLMEEYLGVTADKINPGVWRHKLYANIENIDALRDLKPSIAECHDQYKDLAIRMRKFFEESSLIRPFLDTAPTLI